MADSTPGTTTSATGISDFHATPQFPFHTSPRTWLIVSGISNIGFRLASLLLEHGDNVVFGCMPSAYNDMQTATTTTTTGNGLDQPCTRYESEQLRQFLLKLDDPEEEQGTYDRSDTEYSASQGGGNESPSPSPPPRGPPRRRFRAVKLDPRAAAQCQAAVATAVAAFGSLDVVVCNSSEVVIGTVEELGASDETLALMREQFEVNFYSNVNAIKACVPAMRKSGKGGHIIVITGITGHLGTPGLGAYCAAGWALEGYCDSIAYEIAPFDIKLSIVQPHLETAVLPNRIKAPPTLPHYMPSSHPAPLARNVIGGILDQIHGIGPDADEARRGSPATDQTDSDDSRPVSKTLGSSTSASVHEPDLPAELLDGLISETLFSVCAIGGHPNPPQRHIVGTEGVVSVKEKLKTVSIELEDLVQASTAVDVFTDEDGSNQ